MSLRSHTHFVLLHRLEHRRLCLWRRPVDFVREEEVGENRTGHEIEPPLACILIDLQNFCAGNIRRHQVGCELDAIERQFQCTAERANQKRFGEPRHTDD